MDRSKIAIFIALAAGVFLFWNPQWAPSGAATLAALDFDSGIQSSKIRGVYRNVLATAGRVGATHGLTPSVSLKGYGYQVTTGRTIRDKVLETLRSNFPDVGIQASGSGSIRILT